MWRSKKTQILHFPYRVTSPLGLEGGKERKVSPITAPPIKPFNYNLYLLHLYYNIGG
jgi:hypothetical protein